MNIVQTYFIFSCMFSISIYTVVEGEEVGGTPHHHHAHKKLFVFGDSYADTGNWQDSSAGAISWKEPYGITFPGKPSGRFSDGRVLTDYIASFLGTKSPTPYNNWKKSGDQTSQPYGINFAYGGTGVFNTFVKEPNMTIQIDFFEQLLEEDVFTKHDLNSSIALVSVAGNDYGTYMVVNGSLEGFANFSESVISQLLLNLKRIHSMGVRKIGITAMQPLGCLPQFTTLLSYKNCSPRQNSLAKFHNDLLEKKLWKLNNETGISAFKIIDLYGAFSSALKIQGNHSENRGFENPLKPCCVGENSGDFCGSVDKNGTKKYVVCSNPGLSFFWDAIHPSHHGWKEVYVSLKSSLHSLLI